MSDRQKPLGRKSYGSIGHLPDSRIGPGDHHVHEGQARICTSKVRDRHDRIIVTEKMDGSCTAVANVDGVLVALGRAGWPAYSSKYEQHQMFARWVEEHRWRFERLRPGERLVGEWMAQAHGTIYEKITDPWLVFDWFRDATTRASYEELSETWWDYLALPRLLVEGEAGAPMSVETALGKARFAMNDPVGGPEGAVWRVERKGEFDFMAKYVRPDKQDGIYLPEISGEEAVWNWRP